MTRRASTPGLVLIALVAALLGIVPSAGAAPSDPPDWSTPEYVASTQPELVTSLTGGRALVMDQSWHFFLRDAAGTWTPLGTAGPFALPVAGRGVQVGNEVVVPVLDYVRDSAKDLYVNRIDLTTGAWKGAQLVVDNATPPGPSAARPEAAVSDDGTVVVIAQNTNLGVSATARRPAGSSTWQTVGGLPGWDGGFENVNGQLAALGDGRFVLLQTRIRCACAAGPGSALFTWTLSPGGSWGSEHVLASYADNRGIEPQLAGWGGAHGGALVVWRAGASSSLLAQAYHPQNQQWDLQPTTLPALTAQTWRLDSSRAGAVVVGPSSGSSISSVRYLPDPSTWLPTHQQPWQTPDLVASGQDAVAVGALTLGDDGTSYAGWGNGVGTQQGIRVARGELLGGAWRVVTPTPPSAQPWTLRMDTASNGQPVTTWYRPDGVAGAVALVGDSTVAPELTAEIDAAVPPGGLAVDDETDVSVTVTANVDTDAVSVSLDVPGDSLEVVGTPPGTSGISLAAGVPRTWTWRVRAVEPGSTTVEVSATGTAETGEALTASAEKVIDVEVPKLALGATVAPEELVLAVDEDGEVGEQVVQVELVVRNTTADALTGVVLERAWVRPQVPTQALDQLDFAADTFPLTVGDLEPGEEWTTTLPVAVTGDGKRKVDLLATYDEGGARVVERGTGGLFEATVPPLWWESAMEGDFTVGDRPWVKGGRPFLLSGSVRNLSDWRRLCLAPLRPVLTGNAGGHGVVDLSVFSAADEVAPPLAGTLEPGADTQFGMLVRTLKTGTARNRVQLAPLAYDLGDDGDARCDALDPGADGTVLGASDVTARPGSGDHPGGVDISVPRPPAVDWWSVQSVTNLFGGFSFGAIETTALWLRGTAVGAVEAGVGYWEHPELVLPTLEALWAGAGLLDAYWNAATTEEKRSLYTQIGSVLRRAPGDAYAGVTKVVESSTESWMKRIETAYEQGDMSQVVYAFSYAGGSVGAQVAIELIQAELGVTLTKRIPRLVKRFAAIGAQTKTYATMKAMPVGKLLNRTEMQRIWGAAVDDVKHFTRIAKEEGIIIGIRGRAPISVQNLEKGAVWKHENLKPKNVSDVDIAWLDFQKADRGLVAMRSYTKKAKDEILKRIRKAKLSDGQRAELLKRAEIRFSEVDDYLTKIKKFDDKGEIDVGFNYSENGWKDVPTDSKFRRFALDQDNVGDGIYYRPFQESTILKPGKLPKWCKNFGGTLKVLCRVTGDMDGVYIADASGRALSKERLMRAYRKLAEAGWQHPETFTWVEQMTGAFWFKSKEKILKGLEVGGEKMMEFGPDGLVRATHLNLKASQMTSAQDFFVGRIGGFTATVP